MPRPPRVEFSNAICHLCKLVRKTPSTNGPFISRTLQSLPGRGYELLLESKSLHSPESLRAIGCDQILSVVAKYHEVDPQEYVGYRSGAAGREMADYLCRQWTGVSLAKL